MAKVLSPDLQLLSTWNRVEYSLSNFLQGFPGLIISLERVIDRNWRTVAAVCVLPANHGLCLHCSDKNSILHPQLQLLMQACKGISTQKQTIGLRAGYVLEWGGERIYTSRSVYVQVRWQRTGLGTSEVKGSVLPCPRDKLWSVCSEHLWMEAFILFILWGLDVSSHHLQGRGSATISH